jgi:NAD(P)-dependent dehydrogenase (short-subunit alcohol dehydrogenase family)
LDGKVALINGGGAKSGDWSNGKAAAVLFAREGAKVVIADIDLDAAAATAAIIQTETGQAPLILQADVGSEADMNRVVADVLTHHGRLDILLHVVGIASRGDFLTETEEDFDRVLGINLKGAFFASRAAIRPMLDQGKGCILTVSSHHGNVATDRGQAFSYGVSKAALKQMTRKIAWEYAPRGIRANVLTIGMLDTPMTYRSAGDKAEGYRAARHAASPTGRQGTAWDSAYAALYLASDEAGYINGLDLVIDGGLTLGVTPVFRQAD